MGVENQTPKKPNTSPDKREMQLIRESLKTILILLTGFFLAIPTYHYTRGFGLFEEQQPKIVKVQCKHKPVSEKPKTYKTLKDVCVVIKVSKDVKKYFISYKKFYTETDYKVIVDEISFSEYMLLNSKDTLTTTRFNVK